MGQSVSTITTDFLSTIHGGPFVPTHQDCQLVAKALATKLPLEIVLPIIDFAEYWPCIISQSPRHVIVSAGPSGNRCATQLVVSSPIPDSPTRSAVRRMTVTTESRDQGFSSYSEFHGTRENSSSFFELALVRPISDETATNASPQEITPDRERETVVANAAGYQLVGKVRLHSNIHANRVFVNHSETLQRKPDEEGDHDNPMRDEIGFNERAQLIVCARAGDRFIVSAVAEFPMWSNQVKMARIAIEYMAV